jgi:Ferredoxin-dependent bilin reductase
LSTVSSSTIIAHLHNSYLAKTPCCSALADAHASFVLPNSEILCTEASSPYFNTVRASYLASAYKTLVRMLFIVVILLIVCRAALLETSGQTQVLNFVMFPHPEYDLPIFGADLVSLPGLHLICIDLQVDKNKN